MEQQIGRPIQPNRPTVRSIARVEGENIVVEIFKDIDGKTVSQQAFTLDQLQSTKLQVERQYQDGISRLNEMIEILEVTEE